MTLIAGQFGRALFWVTIWEPAVSESFGTATWLKNIVLKAFGDPLAFLGKGTWLKSIVLKKHLAIPDYFFDYLVWIYLVVPTINWKSNYLLLSIVYNYQATTLSVFLLGNRLAARLVQSNILSCILTVLVYLKLKYLNSFYSRLVLFLNSLFKSIYFYYLF